MTNIKRIIFCGFSSLLFIALIITLFIGVKFYLFSHQLTHQCEDKAEHECNQMAEKISVYFKELVSVIKETTNTLSSKKFSTQETYDYLSTILKNKPNIYLLAIGYKPYAYDPKQKLVSFAVNKENGTIKKIDIKYDYSIPTKQARARTEWYTDTIKNKTNWTEPYWGTATKAHILIYGETIYDQNKKPIGVCVGGFKLDHIRKLVNQLSLGTYGYGFVVSKTGIYASHPVAKYYRNENSIFEIIDKEFSSQMKDIIKKPQGKILNYSSIPLRNITKEKGVLYSRAIPSTNLVLCGVFMTQELTKHSNDTLRRYVIIFSLFLTLSLLISILFFIFFPLFSVLRLKIGSILSTILLVSFLALLWNNEIKYIREEKQQIKIFDHSIINKITEQCASKQREIAPPTKIKTGVVLTNIEYITPQKLKLTGHIWQKYPLNLSKKIIRDFVFPECYKLEEKKLIHLDKNTKEESFLWHFRGYFTQYNISANLFPLDERNITLAIDHPTLNSPVLFVPDLSNYSFISPSLLPGIESHVYIPEWNLKESFFSFSPNKYQDNLGLKNLYLTARKYHLCFHAITQRDVFDSIVMYILPIFVALFILFISLLAASPDKIMVNISLASGVFVGIILAHSALRRTFLGSGIFYLEYFYIIPYFIIILLLLDFILYSRQDCPKIISYHDNLLAKILFWPVFLLAITIITIWVFF